MQKLIHVLLYVDQEEIIAKVNYKTKQIIHERTIRVIINAR